MAHCVHFRKIYLYMVETEKGATAHELARNAKSPPPLLSIRGLWQHLCVGC